MKPTRIVMILIAAAVMAVSMSAVVAQTPETSPAPPVVAHQEHPGGDPIRQLNLTQQQQDQIRRIREKNREERAAINRRLAEANRALQEALEADSPVEAVVEQRMQAVAAEQAAAMRMRILTEVRVRQVLTQEQRAILRSLRTKAQEMRRERRRMESEERIRTGEERRQMRRERRRPMPPRPPAPPQVTPPPQ